MVEAFVLSEGRIRLEIAPFWLGEDLCVHVTGGDAPHIGAVSLSVARASLRGDGNPAASTSNLTLTGHKDDVIAREFSEQLAIKLCKNTVVICGIHVHNITDHEIQAIHRLAKDAILRIVREAS